MGRFFHFTGFQVTNRRRFSAFTAAAWLALVAAPTWAQTPTQAQSKALGVFSLLGENLQVVGAAEVSDTRLDKSLRETLPTKGVGFDQAALRAVQDGMARLQPATKLSMFRATAPITLSEQRQLAQGAERAELPAWIVKAIETEKLTHILLITSQRGDAAFPVSEGHSIGRGTVEGVGLYLDRLYEIRNMKTGSTSAGFIAPFATLRLQLMDTNTGEIVKRYDIRDGYIVGASLTDTGSDPWNYIGPTEKVDRLRQLVQDSVARVLPQVLP
jgi:hypothetical protein